MKHKPHNQKIKSLKIRLYEIEKLLDKISRRSKRQVQSLFRGWVGWWANIIVEGKPKLKTFTIKGKTYYLKKRKSKKHKRRKHNAKSR
jgi:hypothetical protein